MGRSMGGAPAEGKADNGAEPRQHPPARDASAATRPPDTADRPSTAPLPFFGTIRKPSAPKRRSRFVRLDLPRFPVLAALGLMAAACAAERLAAAAGAGAPTRGGRLGARTRAPHHGGAPAASRGVEQRGLRQPSARRSARPAASFTERTPRVLQRAAFPGPRRRTRRREDAVEERCEAVGSGSRGRLLKDDRRAGPDLRPAGRGASRAARAAPAPPRAAAARGQRRRLQRPWRGRHRVAAAPGRSGLPPA